MQKWLFYCILCIIPSSLFILLPHFIGEYYTPLSIGKFQQLIVVILMSLFIFVTKRKFIFYPISIILGSFISFGISANLLANVNSPNPGFAMGITQFQLIYVTLISHYLYNTSLSIKNVGSMLLMILGFVFTGWNPKKQTNISYQWIFWAIISAFLIGTKDLVLKSTGDKLDRYSLTLNMFVVAALVSFGLEYFEKNKLALVKTKKKTKSQKEENIAKLGILLMGISTTIFIPLLIYVINISPVPSYPRAITSISIIFSALIDSYIEKKPINKENILGLFLIVSGVSGIVLSS